MVKVTLIDPGFRAKESIPNLGDQIISRASSKVFLDLFGSKCDLRRVSLHKLKSARDLRAAGQADLVFLGGANSLWFRFFPFASFPIGPLEALFLRRVICLGVGWGSDRLLLILQAEFKFLDI